MFWTVTASGFGTCMSPQNIFLNLSKFVLGFVVVVVVVFLQFEYMYIITYLLTKDKSSKVHFLHSFFFKFEISTDLTVS